MEMKELLEWIKFENKRIKNHFDGADGDKAKYARTIKLVEEIGELCNEVLIHGSHARKEKLENHDSENLAHEFADVLITTLILADEMKVDIEKSLESKMKKIRSRKY